MCVTKTHGVTKTQYPKLNFIVLQKHKNRKTQYYFEHHVLIQQRKKSCSFDTNVSKI